MPITHKRYLHTVSIVCRKYVSSKIHPTHENFPFHHYNSKYIFIYPHAHRKNIHQLSTTQSIPQPAATHHHSLIKHLHSPLPTSNIFFAEPQTLSHPEFFLTQIQSPTESRCPSFLTKNIHSSTPIYPCPSDS